MPEAGLDTVFWRVLGHASPGFTLKVYAHLVPGEGLGALDLSTELARPTRAKQPSESALVLD